MMLSIDIYQWIHSRYDYYDNEEGKYCGDTYTEQVFKEAQEYFNLTKEEVDRLYYKFTEAAQNLKDYQSKFKQAKDNASQFNIAKLDGKKVKMNTEKILKDKTRSNTKFVNFVKNNKNKVFTARAYKKNRGLYVLEEEGLWLFSDNDLIELK